MPGDGDKPTAICVHSDGTEHPAPVDRDGFAYLCDHARLDALERRRLPVDDKPHPNPPPLKPLPPKPAPPPKPGN